MATKTLYLKNAAAPGSAHGSLQSGGSPPASATTGTGWIVGTTTPTKYSLQIYDTERSAATFGTTALPNASPTTTDCWRSETTLNGKFSSGTWYIALSVTGTLASGTGHLRYRLWRSTNANGSSGTEITSGTQTTTNWSNLSVPQHLTGSVGILSAVTLTNEYLFLQVACAVTTASASGRASVLLRVDATNSKLTTPQWTEHRDIADMLPLTGGPAFSETFSRSLEASRTVAESPLTITDGLSAAADLSRAATDAAEAADVLGVEFDTPELELVLLLALGRGCMRYEKFELQVVQSVGVGASTRVAHLAGTTVHLHSADAVGSFQVEGRIGGGENEWYAIGEPSTGGGAAPLSAIVRVLGVFEELRVRTLAYSSGTPAAHAAGFNVTTGCGGGCS